MQAPKFSRRSFLKSGAVAAAAASLPGFSLPAAAAAAPIGTVCQTQHGPVQGIRQEGHLVWYGIPYGASTAGDAPLDSPAGPRPLGRRQRLHRPRRGGVSVQHLRPGHRRLPQIRRLHHGKGQQTACHRLPAQRRQSDRLRAGASGRISGRAAGLCLRGAGIPAGAVRLQLPARVLLRPGGNGQFCPAGHGQGAGLGAGQYRIASAATRRTSRSSALQPAGGTEWPCWPVPCLWAGSRKPSLFPAA